MTDLSRHCVLKRRLSQSVNTSTVLLPSDTCTICDKKRKTIHGSTETEKLIKCETKAAKKCRKEYAMSSYVVEVMGRIQHLYLVARGAHCPDTCRRDLARDVGRHAERETKLLQQCKQLTETPSTAYVVLC